MYMYMCKHVHVYTCTCAIKIKCCFKLRGRKGNEVVAFKRGRRRERDRDKQKSNFYCCNDEYSCHFIWRIMIITWITLITCDLLIPNMCMYTYLFFYCFSLSPLLSSPLPLLSLSLSVNWWANIKDYSSWY